MTIGHACHLPPNPPTSVQFPTKQEGLAIGLEKGDTSSKYIYIYILLSKHDFKGPELMRTETGVFKFIILGKYV